MDILTIGEALVEVMRLEVDEPLDRPGLFTGPYPSGAPFIFAVQAARLGAQVMAIGSVGNDAFADCLVRQLIQDGIDPSGLRRLNTHTTGVAFVAYNNDGTRNFVFSLGAGGQITADMLNEEYFEGSRCLHLMGSTLSINEAALQVGLKALSLAQKHGVLFSFDPNIRPELMPPKKAKAAFSPFLEAADILLPTSEELMLLTGKSTVTEASELLLENHPEKIIVLTLGAQGCAVITAKGIEHIPGFSVKEIDPTGAGDCFDAGFLTRWLSGDSPAEAAKWANACGALAVTAKGPMAGAVSLIDVRAFMDSQS